MSTEKKLVFVLGLSVCLFLTYRLMRRIATLEIGDTFALTSQEPFESEEDTYKEI